MDRRSYAVGICVGQYISKRDISKEDIMKFFEKQCANDNCVAACSFADQCHTALALSNAAEQLCITLRDCAHLA